jgi:adenine-specific DNA-methyltransferase
MEAATQPPTLEEELAGDHGEVFTRRWVVDLILDLVGYTVDQDLASMRVVEPSCGSGAFLIATIERLVASAAVHGRDLAAADDALLAVDLLQSNVERSLNAVVDTLCLGGVDLDAAQALSSRWVQQRDFLLQPPAPRTADFVVGNPPYIRLEAVPKERSDAYRRACLTMGGRADVYVGFYEHGLLALREGGTLGYICADRWMRNTYGAKLRELVSSGWSVDALLSLTGVDAFEDEVDAYPAVTVISRRPQLEGPLVVEGAASFGPEEAREVAELGRGHTRSSMSNKSYRAARLRSWPGGRAGWPNGSPEQLAVIARLEAEFRTLEDVDTGTKVGIGVATGADKVFIVRDADLVEPERLLPLALPRDIASGRVEWSGRFLVNPWDPDGLVNLEDWPRLANYLAQHRGQLSERHTAKTGRWHKTIDRVIEGLGDSNKLYLPDFKEAIFPVLDDGATYPHHNLYWVTSTGWDLKVLGGLLLSDIANLFIEAYSVRMRGGYLRFQAQYLRRIRLPRMADIDTATAEELSNAFSHRDRAAATAAALPLYNLIKLPT